MYYWKKITSVGGILGIMLLGLGVFFYLSHFAWKEQNAYTGISVYAAEQDYQEHFSPINITLKENQKDKIQLDYLCKIGDSYMIIGKIEDLNTNAGYYLKGMTNLKEKIEFHTLPFLHRMNNWRIFHLLNSSYLKKIGGKNCFVYRRNRW